MHDKPRPRHEGILTKPFLLSVGLEGLVIAAATIIAFHLGLNYGGQAAGATMAFSNPVPVPAVPRLQLQGGRAG